MPAFEVQSFSIRPLPRQIILPMFSRRLVPLLIALIGTVTAVLGASAKKPTLVLLIAARSYETDRTLPRFATDELATEFQTVVVTGAMTSPMHQFENIDAIDKADVLLVSVWRRAPPPGQLEVIRRYVATGRAVVGIATASHAFAIPKAENIPTGGSTWPEWDAQVIGGHYTGHHPIRFLTTVTAVEPGHALLRGVTLPFRSKMELNQVQPLQPGAHALLLGTIEGQPPEPVAWTFQHVGGGRTFFTPLGHPEDFENGSFRRLLRNGVRWAAGLPGE